MGRFQKGQPRPKNAGRKPGSRNKVTATIKQSFEGVFKELQADPRRNLMAWATKNRGNLRLFYQIAARFIPIEAHVVTPPPIDSSDMHEVARRLAVLFRRVREAEAARVPQLPEKVVTSDS